ncbi:hypothetical protein [Methyloglobulus sp.]|uniref:hypothetical protein n=1 Tax=Methyloglobulus sp. TaxID=2518622 RepID=UPI00398A07D1
MNLTQKKCQLCSKFSSRLKKLLIRLGFGVVCECIHWLTNESEQRVPEFNSQAPDCVCEKHKANKYSPGTVENAEQITLFVFQPMHDIDKNGNAKPRIFSHISVKGRSVQRDTIATNNEFFNFVQNFLDDKNDRAWKGVLLAKCDIVRNILIENSDKRSVCIYDTAEKENPAHAEIFRTQHIISEADNIELRRKLLAAFGNGNIIQPNHYRQGTIWNNLSREIQTR